MAHNIHAEQSERIAEEKRLAAETPLNKKRLPSFMVVKTRKSRQDQFTAGTRATAATSAGFGGREHDSILDGATVTPAKDAQATATHDPDKSVVDVKEQFDRSLSQGESRQAELKESRND